MSSSFLIKKPGFCARCGHYATVGSTGRALKALGVEPHDVVVVTDIGCLGIIDKSLSTHTIHGLHGRSVALGVGLAMGLPPHKKVIVFIGDGGATIGLQHLLEAARRNVNMTVIVYNNMLYGMTGGQPSGLTPRGFVTRLTPAPEGSKQEPYDLCGLLHQARAAYVHRVTSEDKGELVRAIKAALETEGFALVEVLEWCTGRNPGVREKKTAQLNAELKEWADRSRWALGPQHNPPRPNFSLDRSDKPSLLEGLALRPRFRSSLTRPLALVLGGRAGGRIRSAAAYLSRGAVLSGLQVTQRNSYPVTVESGHSVSEVILSPDEIFYMGIDKPDIVIVLFKECLPHIHSRLMRLTEQDTLYVNAALWENGLLPTEIRARTVLLDFRRKSGFAERYWGVMALAEVLRHSQLYDLEAFKEAVSLRKRFAPENLAAIEASEGLAVAV